MPSVLRSVAAFAFVTAVALLSAPGCSQQGEGQRCDSAANGNLDCDDNLVCIKMSDLSNGLADICCHADPANDTESRCQRGESSAPVGGSGGSSSGGSATVGGAGAAAAGAAAAGEAAGGSPGAGGMPGASGSPTTPEGGMSGAGGAPPTTEGGAAGAATAGQGGAG